MRNPARSDRYCTFIASLENYVLYSSEGVLQHAADLGLLLREELQADSDFLRSAAHALTMRITRKSEGQPDGFDRTVPEALRDAYLGIRWKVTIPDRYLEESDRRLVQRYLQDADFRESLVPVEDLTERLEAAPEQRSTGNGLSVPLLWALAVAALVLALTIIGRPLTPEDRLGALVEREDLPALRALLETPGWAPSRDTVVASIAKLHHKLGHEVPIFASIEELTAVFAFEHDPQLMFGYRVLRTGDLLTLAEDHGYLTEIGRTAFVLHTDEGLRSFPYPTLTLFGNANWSTPSVLVFPGSSALAPVLEHACREAGYRLELEGLAGPIVGAFDCSSFAAFIDRVAPDLGLICQGRVVRADQPGKLRACIGFDRFFPFVETTVGEALAEYQRLLDLHLIVHSRRLSTPIALPPTQLADFMTQLDFRVRVLGLDLVEIEDPT